MSTSSPNFPAPRRRRRRLIIITCLFLLLILGVPVGGHLYYRWSASRALAEAIADADRMDPDWRLEQLAAKLPNVPPEENGTGQIIAIGKLLPKNWYPFKKSLRFPNENEVANYDRDGLIGRFEMQLDDMPPPSRLNAQQLQALQLELDVNKDALAEARKLAKFTRGRADRPREFELKVPDSLSAGRDVFRLLGFDALVSAQNHKHEAALDACRGILITAKIVGEEADLPSAIVRVAGRGIGTRMLERVLARGTPAAEALERVQALLRQEEAAPVCSWIAKVDRAAMDAFFGALEAGEVDPRFEKALVFKSDDADHLTAFIAWYKCEATRARADMLRQLNADVAESLLPPEKLWPKLRHLREHPQEIRLLTGWTRSPFPNTGASALRSQMFVRTAIVGMAIERHRMVKKQWPAKLDDLVPAYLESVPLDYFDPREGQPLRYRRLKDGVVVYSVGPDGVDNGGRLRADPEEVTGSEFRNLDFGFQLWDVESRRQEPLPPLRIPDPPPEPWPGEVP